MRWPSVPPEPHDSPPSKRSIPLCRLCVSVKRGCAVGCPRPENAPAAAVSARPVHAGRRRLTWSSPRRSVLGLVAPGRHLHDAAKLALANVLGQGAPDVIGAVTLEVEQRPVVLALQCIQAIRRRRCGSGSPSAAAVAIFRHALLTQVQNRTSRAVSRRFFPNSRQARDSWRTANISDQT
jgi:hypothetical protein